MRALSGCSYLSYDVVRLGGHGVTMYLGWVLLGLGPVVDYVIGN